MKVQIAKSLPEDVAAQIAALDLEGAACRDCGNIARAEECFLRGWELIPDPKAQWGDTMSSALGIAEFYVKTGQYQKAIDWIPNLILVNPTGFETHVDLMIGRIYLESGRKAEGIRWFQKVHDSAGAVAFRGNNKPFLELVQSKTAVRKRASELKPDDWPEVPDPEAYKLMAGPLELDDDVHEEIKRLCAEGDELAEAGRYDDAVGKYREALFKLPRPVEKWEASAWIYAAIGDALFLKGDFLAAAKPLRDVMYCPGAQENGFIRLRRGQVAFGRGNLSAAEKEFVEAHRLEGEKIFAQEDPKYWQFIRNKLKS